MFVAWVLAAFLGGCSTEIIQTLDKVCAAGSTQLCACAGGFGAQACDLNGNSWATCDCSAPPSVAGSTIVLKDVNGTSVPALANRHVRGLTPCEQALGTVELTNPTDAAIAIQFATTDGEQAIVTDPPSPVAVGAGETVAVEVKFDCSRLGDRPLTQISTSLEILGPGESIGQGLRFPVDLVFDDPPAAQVMVIMADAAGASVDGLDVTHVVGENDCVQPLGSVTIANPGTEALSAEVTVQNGDPTIVTAPENPVSVPAGGSLKVNVTFDCSRLTAPPVDVATKLAGAETREFDLALTFVMPEAPEPSVELLDVSGAAVSAIAETHIPGTTDCEQPLGSVRIDNPTDAAVSATVSTASSDPTIVFAPEPPYSVPAGGDLTVAFGFDCSKLTAEPVDIATKRVVEVGGASPIEFDLGLMFVGAP